MTLARVGLSIFIRMSFGGKINLMRFFEPFLKDDIFFVKKMVINE